MFLSYSTTQSVYHCLLVPSGRIYTSRHVQFDDSTFPLATLHFSPSSQTDMMPIVTTSMVTQLSVPLLSITPLAPPPCLDPHRQTHMSLPQVPSKPRPIQVLSSNLTYPSSSTTSEPTAPNQNELPPPAQLQTNLTDPAAPTHNRLQPISTPSS